MEVVDDIRILGPTALTPRESVCRSDLPEWVDGRVRLIRVGAWQEGNLREHYRKKFREVDSDSYFVTDGMYAVFQKGTGRPGFHWTSRESGEFRPEKDRFDPATVDVARAIALLEHEEETVRWSAARQAENSSDHGYRRGKPAIRHEVDWYLDGSPGYFRVDQRRSERYEQEASPYSQQAVRAEQEAFKAEIIAGSSDPESMRALLDQSPEGLASSLKQFEEQLATHVGQVQENLQKQQVELEAQLAEAVQERAGAQDQLRRTGERLDELADRVEDAHAARESARADLAHTISKIGSPEIAAILKILESDDSEAKKQIADEARAAYPTEFLGLELHDLYLMGSRGFLRSLHKGQKELHRAVRKANDQRRRERGSHWRLGSLQPADKAELVGILDQANALRLTVLICRGPHLGGITRVFEQFRQNDLAFMQKLGITPSFD